MSRQKRDKVGFAGWLAGCAYSIVNVGWDGKLETRQDERVEKSSG